MFKNTTLSQEEIDIILGGLLGDACLRKNSNSIQFLQSTKQTDYLLWKYDFLKFHSSEVSIRKTNQGYENISFSVKNKNNELNYFYQQLRRILMDKDRKKIINYEYLNLLSPLSLSIWWLDDGCLSIHKGNRYGKLCTHCFSYDEHLIIQKYFKDKWDINIDIKIEKQKYYFCRLNVENLKKLIKIIFPYVIKIPTMIYKIDLNYKNNVNLGDFESTYNIIKNS